MSYEGYSQNLCANGHLYNTDCYSTSEERICSEPGCGSESVFSNEVDQTNGGDQGVINDWSSLQIEGAVHKKCGCCEHISLVSAARYRIPTQSEQEALRSYEDDYA